MPRAKHQCATNDCIIRIDAGKTHCAEHTLPYANSTHRSNNWTWIRLRKQILERDNWICYLCGGPNADTVDHIVPLVLNGSDEPNNLAAVHDRNFPHCHRKKTRTDGRKPIH